MMDDYLNNLDVNVNHFSEVYPELLNENQSRYYDLNSFRLQCVKSVADLLVLCTNIGSLYCKLDEFQAFLSGMNCKPDFICLTET